MSEHTYTNKRIHEKSPYFFQYEHNLVDWWWCSEAFEKVRSKDKMLFVVIGYATCRWCHVMELESFEDPDLAEYMLELIWWNLIYSIKFHIDIEYYACSSRTGLSCIIGPTKYFQLSH